MTSPLFGMAHGNYLFRYHHGEEVFQVMPKAHNTAYTEFGVPSISNLACCKMAADSADIFPMVENAITVAHHAFFAWSDKEPWACLTTIRDYFGEAESLEQLISLSQWLQSEGYKCIYEEARRQKPYCSMAINWCYSEPWPTLANNSLINYPAEPKASCRDVADACRKALVSARIPKFAWRGGETFSADLWLLNDSSEVVTAGQAEISLELCGETYPLLTWDFADIAANNNFEGPSVRMKLPDFAIKGDSTASMLNQGSSKREKGKLHEMTLVIKAGILSSKYRLIFNE
jgi:beta-mannosidase